MFCYRLVIMYQARSQHFERGGVHFWCQLTEGCDPNFSTWWSGALQMPQRGPGQSPGGKCIWQQSIENWLKIRSLASKKSEGCISYGVPTKLKSGRGHISGFPCVGMRLVYWSLRCTATFVFRFHWSLLLAFSLHFSSSSAVLRSLLTQSSHLSCGLPRFLQPSCFFVLDIFGHLSSFILTMYPAHLIPLLTILPTICNL